MNIVFWVLVVLALVGLWLALSSSFWKIGDFFTSAWNDAKEAMTEKPIDTEDNENE